MDIIQSFEPALEQIDSFTRTMLDELIKNAGVAQYRFRRWLFRVALTPPARRFAHIAVRFEYIVRQYDFQQAARDLLSKFVDQVDVLDLESVPREGPLLIAANHPGTYDALSIISNLPRDDLKVVISGIPFTQGLHHTSKYFIYSPPPDQIHGRMNTLRSSVRHLQDGGALLLFPTGRVDPDPAVTPGAALAIARWSRSLEVLLRRAPDTQVLLTIVSGVITPKSLSHPITKLLRTIEPYKTAQIVQVAGQLFMPQRNRPLPQISFGSPLIARDLLENLPEYRLKWDASQSAVVLNALIERARQRLIEHLDIFGINQLDSVARLAK